MNLGGPKCLHSGETVISGVTPWIWIYVRISPVKMSSSHLFFSERTYGFSDCIGQVLQKSLLPLRELFIGRGKKAENWHSISKIVRYSGSGQPQPQIKSMQWRYIICTYNLREFNYLPLRREEPKEHSNLVSSIQSELKHKPQRKLWGGRGNCVAWHLTVWSLWLNSLLSNMAPKHKPTSSQRASLKKGVIKNNWL